MLSDHELVLRISDHGFISSGAASLTSDLSMSLSPHLRPRFREHLLSVSDHDSMSICSTSQTINFLWHQNLRSWACVPANISETHPSHNHKVQGAELFNHCCTVGECNFIGRNHPEKISADKERFKFTRPFQQVLSALILFCGLAFINHPVLVMS